MGEIMFCEQCGTKIEEDSTFCHNCGAKIGQVGTLKNNDKKNSSINPKEQGIVLSEENSKSKGKLIGTLAIVAVVIIVGILYFNNRKIPVNLNKYVTISTEGYNTLGQADYQFDYNSFYEDYKDKIKMQTNNGKSVMVQDWLGDNYFAVEMLREYFGGSLNQTTKISNGDTITFSWHCEDDVIKELFNCKLNYSDINVKVSGLDEIQTFDPFQYIDVEIEGILPKVTISVNNNSNNEVIGDMYFSPVINPTMKNGDKITVQATVRGSEEKFIEKYGMLPSPVEKQYNVNGFHEYIFTKSQLTKKHMEELENLTYKELMSESWDSSETVENVEFLGTYITSQKEPIYGDHEEYGSIYVVCKVKVNCSLDTTQGLVNYPVEYYYYVNFENVVLKTDGELGQANAYDTCYGPFNRYDVDTGYGSSHQYYYYGYGTLEELYESITYRYDLDDYNCEENIK